MGSISISPEVSSEVDTGYENMAERLGKLFHRKAVLEKLRAISSEENVKRPSHDEYFPPATWIYTMDKEIIPEAEKKLSDEISSEINPMIVEGLIIENKNNLSNILFQLAADSETEQIVKQLLSDGKLSHLPEEAKIKEWMIFYGELLPMLAPEMDEELQKPDDVEERSTLQRKIALAWGNCDNEEPETLGAATNNLTDSLVAFRRHQHLLRLSQLDRMRSNIRAGAASKAKQLGYQFLNSDLLSGAESDVMRPLIELIDKCESQIVTELVCSLIRSVLEGSSFHGQKIYSQLLNEQNELLLPDQWRSVENALHISPRTKELFERIKHQMGVGVGVNNDPIVLLYKDTLQMSYDEDKARRELDLLRQSGVKVPKASFSFLDEYFFPQDMKPKLGTAEYFLMNCSRLKRFQRLLGHSPLEDWKEEVVVDAVFPARLDERYFLVTDGEPREERRKALIQAMKPRTLILPEEKLRKLGKLQENTFGYFQGCSIPTPDGVYVGEYEIVVNEDMYRVNGEDFTDLIPCYLAHEIGEMWDLIETKRTIPAYRGPPAISGLNAPHHIQGDLAMYRDAFSEGKAERLLEFVKKWVEAKGTNQRANDDLLAEHQAAYETIYREIHASEQAIHDVQKQEKFSLDYLRRVFSGWVRRG